MPKQQFFYLLLGRSCFRHRLFESSKIAAGEEISSHIFFSLHVIRLQFDGVLVTRRGQNLVQLPPAFSLHFAPNAAVHQLNDPLVVCPNQHPLADKLVLPSVAC